MLLLRESGSLPSNTLGTNGVRLDQLQVPVTDWNGLEAAH